MKKPHLVGVNHVALEVGDVEQALHFYSSVFQFELRGSHKAPDGALEMAFIDMGDQFLALSRGRHQAPDRNRHFGLVVDDAVSAGTLAEAAGAVLIQGGFIDPWGNRIEIVDYADIQFTKSDGALRSMGIHPVKSMKAMDEIRRKGMASK